MATIRVLQVASFSGNIGDNANHRGFRRWFEGLIGAPVAWSEFETREVYRKQRAFDLAFAAEANRHDLLVVGGGNYFELWVDSSPTGTSVSITDEALAALTVPVFFNALGVDAGQGVPVQSLGRFRRFLGYLLGSDRFLVSVRNDGSWSTLSAHAGDLAIGSVLRLPDGGFFAGYGGATVRKPPTDAPVIGINLAGDMSASRFPGGEMNTCDMFIDEFARFIIDADRLYPAARYVFFPHIFRDLKMYSDLLERLPDTIVREKCRVAPYDAGDAAADEVFSAYRTCSVILGMRFHANVVAIGSGVPTVGLVCYDQIRLLYDEFGRPDLTVDVRRPGFGSELLARVRSALEQPEQALSTVGDLQRQVEGMRHDSGLRLRHWLHRQMHVGRTDAS
jgi:polysaccharide pyruvyl transferase WcaK-like protein